MAETKKKLTNPKSHKVAASKPTNNQTLDGWLEIGIITSAQGLKGELRVYPISDFPERFEEPGQRWLLQPDETEPQPVELVQGRYVPGKNVYIIVLAGVTNRDRAEALEGCKLLVPESDRPQLAEGEYHVLDLIGLEVFHQETSESVGVVVDIIPAGNDLLEVKRNEVNAEGKKSKNNLLIPFVKEIVPVVDIPNHRIEITPPPGLLDLE